MYSVVLMTALTTGMDLPDRRGGCCGCCGGGWGGCYGGGMGYGCMGYGGGCMGCGGGCIGSYGGGGMGYGGGVILQGGSTIQPSGEKAPAPKEKRDESLLPAPVTLVVDLPADAKLRIENEATTSTGASRVFQSPTLNPGKEYQYTLTAEVVRDGKPIKAEQVVTVKAGQVIPVTLTLPKPGVAQR